MTSEQGPTDSSLSGPAPARTDASEVPAPILAIEHLSFRYPTGQLAFTDVNFRMRAGEVVGLIGPNGAGKTTLMMHLNGLLPGDGVLRQSDVNGRNGSAGAEPSIRVAGLPMIKRNLAEIRRLVGFVFQDPDDQLFCPTVFEDIAFGPLNLKLSRAEVIARVGECLAAVGLAGFEQRSTQHLSFGERKRVCLAGVMACRPILLVLDEPSSNLDLRARRQFISILKSYPAAQLIASHDLEMILEICSRIIVIDKGEIRADGPTREILSDARLLERHGLEVPLSVRYGRVP